jgi:hypothetical protein
LRIDCDLHYYFTNVDSHPFDNHIINSIINSVKRKLNSKLSVGSPLISVCDPFANKQTNRRQGERLISNDLNPVFNATYNLEANDFGSLMLDKGEQFDLILFDPPYSLNQLKLQYEGMGKDLPQWQAQNQWGRCKDTLAQCVKVGGYVISLGWHSKGFGNRRGFQKKELHVLTMSGRDGRYDLLVLVEQKTQTNLDNF